MRGWPRERRSFPEGVCGRDEETRANSRCAWHAGARGRAKWVKKPEHLTQYCASTEMVSTRVNKNPASRVQKLRAREIEEKKREAERDTWFNKERPMAVPKKSWKEKRIEREGRDSSSDSDHDAAVGEPGMEVDVDMVFPDTCRYGLPAAEVR
jgi:hypothetical protein